MDELTREFLIESQEGLDRMERCLTDLENRPDDAALIAEIFRSVHTIKGTTGFLGYKRLEKLSHAGESLLGQLREGKLSATAPIVTVLLQLLDGLRSILRAIEANETEGAGEDEKLIQDLEQLQANADISTTVVDSAVKRRSRKKAAAVGVPPSTVSRTADIAAHDPTTQLIEASPDAAAVDKAERGPSPSENISKTPLSGIASREHETATLVNASTVAASESLKRLSRCFQWRVFTACPGRDWE